MNISKFKHFVKCRNQSGNRSSGGLSVYVNQKLAEGVSYIPSEEKKLMVRCKLDKSYLNFQNDIYRGTVYLSPPNYERNNSEDLIREEDLIRRRNVFIFTKGWHIVQGDYNARTGDIQETVLDDDNVFLNVPEDHENDEDGHKIQVQWTLGVEIC